MKIEGRIYNDSKDIDNEIKSIVDDPVGAVLRELVGTTGPKGTFVDYLVHLLSDQDFPADLRRRDLLLHRRDQSQLDGRTRRSGGDAEHRLRYVCSVQARLTPDAGPCPVSKQ